MADWSLAQLLAGMHENVRTNLELARKNFTHPGTKGDAAENVWIDLFNEYLPERYTARKAHIVDSLGKQSDQIDVVVFDRQYTPFVFTMGGQITIPAESVYAVFEAKQTVNAGHLQYAKEKIESVRRLHRTSLPIPHAGGTYKPKPPIPIIGGFLALDSDWTPKLGESLTKNLQTEDDLQRLEIGCVAAHGSFLWNKEQHEYWIDQSSTAASKFLFQLISLLQFSGTVPMIDVMAYAQWLDKK